MGPVKPHQEYRDQKERFDEWSESYEQGLLWKKFFLPLHIMIVKRAGGASGLTVLDLGCGTGDLLRRFAEAGASELIGIDTSEGMLKVASRLSSGEPGIRFLAASAERLPLETETVDIVTSCIAFHHFPDPPGALREAGRVLKRGGTLLLCDMSRSGAAGRAMLAIGRWRKADRRYFDPSRVVEMLAGTGLYPLHVESARRLPPVFLLEARKA